MAEPEQCGIDSTPEDVEDVLHTGLPIGRKPP